jgi:Microsomal signal peptidase 25 kDa subunit (SPC25)
VYFVLNGLLTAWVWLGESGLIFDGARGGGDSLRVWALTEKEKWTPGFGVKAQWTGEMGEGGKEVRGKFTEWFDEKGFMVEGKLREWLVGALPVLKGTVGKRDGGEKEALGDLGQIDGGVDTPAKAGGKKGRKKG